MTTRTLTARIALAAALSLPTLASANPSSPIDCDFDGDGYDDLAMPSPGESVGSRTAAGAVNILYGASSGLRAVSDEIFHQNSSSVEGIAETDDAFAGALACGDFDDDGYDDLVIGVPQEDYISTRNSGAVQVIYGSPFGLWPTDDVVFTENSAGIQDSCASGDRFGAALATGDIDGDGYDDLVIGVPGQDVSGSGNAGAIHVLFGGYGGLYASGSQYFTENSRGVLGTSESGDLFGASLAIGDFDGDGYDDIGIGAPGEDVIGPDPAAPGLTKNLSTAGEVHVLFGGRTGVTTWGDYLWNQGSSGIIGTVEQYDRFGTSLAAGDFDHDGRADLAIGAPGESVGSISSAGAVNVIYGTVGGMTTLGDQIFYQGIVAGGAEARDRFGEMVVAADFDGDNYVDLAVGAPGEGVADKLGAGAVHIILGSNSGLDEAGNQIWYQDQPGVLYDSEAGDRFGDTLSVGDYDNDGRADLAIGVPGESVGSTEGVGVMQVLYGIHYGLTSTGNQIWHQGISGVEGAMEAYDLTGGVPMSTGVYRFPYADNTQVRVTNDAWTHRPFGRIDMSGRNGGGTYFIAAADDGVIMAIVDTNVEPTDNNNYVWIAHSNGEWTKYSHVDTGSVSSRGWQVGNLISSGAIIGVESDIGLASGDHLHFEVAVPDDLASPLTSGGYIRGDNRIPRICGIPGNTFIGGETYTADGC